MKIENYETLIILWDNDVTWHLTFLKFDLFFFYNKQSTNNGQGQAGLKFERAGTTL